MIDNDNNDGYQILNMVCGPSLPDYLIELKKVKDQNGFEEIIKPGLSDLVDKHKIRDYFSKFPKEVYLCNQNKN
jgi:hypothetical protein